MDLYKRLRIAWNFGFFSHSLAPFFCKVSSSTHKVSKVKIQVHPESHMGSQAEGDSTGVGAGRDS